MEGRLEQSVDVKGMRKGEPCMERTDEGKLGDRAKGEDEGEKTKLMREKSQEQDETYFFVLCREATIIE